MIREQQSPEPSPLHILQVSTADHSGGAERSAWNLFQVYRDRGHESWLAVGRKYSDDPDVIVIPNQRRQNLWGRFCRRVEGWLRTFEKSIPGLWRMRGPLAGWSSPWQKVQRSLGLEDFNYAGTRQLLTLPPRRPDIVHCHNLHGRYFDLRILPQLSHEVPVIVNLRDAWLLSGHCAHSFACERWKTGCGHCPDLTIYPAIERDATAYNWRRKRDIFARSRLYVTAPSQWLMHKVEESILAPAIVKARVIPNGVDLSEFHPADRQHVRAVLGIRQDAEVLLFTANGIRQNIWKDYATMKAAVAQVAQRMHGRNLIFIALGEDGPPERIGDAEVRFVPYQKDRGAVARYFQAADLYIHAARAEVWGLTITEALACGTPVVATGIGGIPEQVKGLELSQFSLWNSGLNRYGMNEATGVLVPGGDAQAMAVSIERLLTDDFLRLRLGENAAVDAAKRFDLQGQADRFLAWYQEIVNENVTIFAKRARYAM
ncbi:MAG: glycosyltransferase [Nitrospirae bacterium]|nr:glycosyltransferase [Nitrospirota bacterium]MDE3041926.1 glycosyltransferase [Nitrospirota bacterium]MDE3049834.1 glycosyltransferase [Nitrospirota bacterium]